MKWPIRFLVGAVVAAGVFAAGVFARAETCSLELKRLDSQGSSGFRVTNSDYLYRATYPQSFYAQIATQTKGSTRFEFPELGWQAAAFKRIVKKEPKYACEHPFRGVAKLGSHEYAFVLDYVPPKEAKKAKPDAKDEKSKPGDGKNDGKKDAKTDSAIGALSGKIAEATAPASQPSSTPKATGFNRLYFDFNHNGDLTDDKVVQGEAAREVGWVSGGGSYVQVQFPRIDITLDVQGTPVAYAFFLAGTVYVTKDYGYASISLNAAAYREGDISLAGKKRHVVLIDFNSNGRFDDVLKVSTETEGPQQQLYPEQGDMLVVDPNSPAAQEGSPYDAASSTARHYVSKLVNIDERFYEMKVSPAGDRLTLTPSTAPLGKVTNPHGKFQAVIYGDRGSLQIHGEKGAAIPVPEGEWKLLSYSLDLTGAVKPNNPEAGKPAASKRELSHDSLWEVLGNALDKAMGGSVSVNVGPQNSIVAAQATAAYPAIKVSKGQTVQLPFGPPYKPLVTGFATAFDGKEKQKKATEMNLQMALIGSAGEVCTNMTVNGGRPSKPKFTITDPNGEVVQQGNFEYG